MTRYYTRVSLPLSLGWRLVAFVLCSLVLGVLAFAVVDRIADRDMASVSGQAMGPCAALRSATISVADFSGALLSTQPADAPIARGTQCTSYFTVADLPQRELYRVSIAGTSVLASADRVALVRVS